MGELAIKAVGDYELDVLGIPFGSPDEKDAEGEYFTAATKLHLDRYSPAVVYYHGYGDNKRPAAEPQYIGRVVSHEVKSDGVWFRVALDKAHALAQKVWEAAKRGVARASSGSIVHLTRYERDGKILEWPVAELSIFEADGGKQPANKRAVALPVMKAVYDAAGLTLPADIEPEPEGKADSAPESAESATPVKASEPDVVKTGAIKMDAQEVQALVASAVTNALQEERNRVTAEAEAEKVIQARIDAAVALKAQELEAEAAKSNRLPGGGAPHVRQFGNLDKYDNMETDDLAFMIGVLDEAKTSARSKYGISENALKAFGVRVAESNEDRDRPVQRAMKAAGMSLKANELNQSTLADYGDEWVALGYSRSLWEKVRETSNVVGRLPTIEVPQGVESVTIPLEGTAPTFYKVAQASAQDTNTLGRITPTHTSSKMGTGQRVLNVGKLGARVAFSGELEEDSMIPWVSELRRGLELEAGEVLESLVIDGDTATGATTNINDIGGTPTGNEYFLVLDGFRKLALLGASGTNARSAGTLALSDYLETLKLMGLGGRNALTINGVSLITDVHTAWKSLEIAEVQTQDVYSQPTIERGVLTSVYGREIIVSPNMHRANQDTTYGLKANSAGKVDLDTAGNNLYGAILAVRWDQWRLGWKRRIRFEVTREPLADASEIIVNMRVGLNYRDAEAAAISYGVSL